MFDVEYFDYVFFLILAYYGLFLFMFIILYFFFFSLFLFLLFCFFFFFQAEDGIRDHCVTGVQTCALPIWLLLVRSPNLKGKRGDLEPKPHHDEQQSVEEHFVSICLGGGGSHVREIQLAGGCIKQRNAKYRSEERRVGKRGDSDGHRSSKRK